MSSFGVMVPMDKFVVDGAEAEETTMEAEAACSCVSVMATKTKAPDLGRQHKFEARATRQLQ